MSDQRQNIINSVFSRRNAAGNLEETYIAHVKIWEDAGPEGGGRKPRYILLSQASNGGGFIHKSKLNTNGTFSVGKTWRLSELRAIQVLNPNAFNITLARTYKWQTEEPTEQLRFLEALIQLFRFVTGGANSLELDGISDAVPAGRQPIQSDYWRRTRTPSPDRPATIRPASQALGPRTSSQAEYNQTPQTIVRGPSPNAIPGSQNADYHYSSSSFRRDPIQPRTPRPPSPARQLQSTPARVRQSRLSSASSNMIRTPSQIPSLDSQPTSTRAISTYSTQAPTDLDQHATTQVDDLAPPQFKTTSISPIRPHNSSEQSARTNPAPPHIPPIRRDQNIRISFFDPANREHSTGDLEGEEENTYATLANVEEMVEGYEWATDDVLGRKTARGAADLIEARLLDELTALDKANIHSFLESDDRINIVLKYMDEALSELDNMDSLVSSYKIHLNAVSDDITYIQSQNRGLQVQTQNQRGLLNELENLLQTVQVNQDALITLTQESLEKAKSIQLLEEAAAELYKALQAGRDTDMAATMERLQEYRTHNAQFCKRIHDFLSIMFTAQSKILLGDTNGVVKASNKARPIVVEHQEIENYLGRYAGLMLYLKEMDEGIYGKLCAAYFSAASELHGTQVRSLFATYSNYVKKAPDDDVDQGLPRFTSPNTANSKGAAGIRRAGTLIRSPIDSRHKDKDKNQAGDLRVSEVFGLILEQIAPLVYRESDFITDFLQINDAALTFADYMGLDHYFRRQAARAVGLSQTTVKLIRGAMDLILGFLPSEMKTWLDAALGKDRMEVVGVLASLERFLAEAEERNNQFLVNMLGKQQNRLRSAFDRHVTEQLKNIEQTKLTSKKRRGVAHFVKHFPVYIGRIETQLIGADGLEVRVSVDAAYEKIVQAMFDCLKHMAKLDGEGEDKGQLNYHVILIENMHYFVAETSSIEIGSVSTFTKRAESIYDESLGAYVRIVLRRPFAKILDYFDGIERQLKTVAPTDIVANNGYNKSTLKKIVKEYNTKDVRKHVEILFKRVEKHFTEASEKPTTEDNGGIAPGTVLVGVWKACEEELLKSTNNFTRLISLCYGDTGISLEYTTVDIEAAFRRHRAGL
ncbi:exocyst complex component Sec3-domain-containing protein [Infundibulicybe gibba]|nr:exocyst complex component Sec3-domain-containing protein [Infundibulicybe gibba]